MRLFSAGSPATGESEALVGMGPNVGPGDAKCERPVDLVHLARQTFGDKRLETELLRLFVRQADQIVATLEGQGPQRPDGQPAADLLHMLLGSARVVGATAVATLAQQFEAEWRQAGASQVDLPDRDRARLRDAVRRTNDFIAELLEAA